MERDLKIISYLLARLVIQAEDIEPNELMEQIESLFPKPKKGMTVKEKVDAEAVERIYALYPAKCPISKRATGKSSSDKRKIERLLLTRKEEDLTAVIKRYTEECIKTQSYIKNFATFLNNIPDYEAEPPRQEDGSHAAKVIDW